MREQILRRGRFCRSLVHRKTKSFSAVTPSKCASTPKTRREVPPVPARSSTITSQAGSASGSIPRCFLASKISPDYDSIIAKLIVWGRDRSEALRALGPGDRRVQDHRRPDDAGAYCARSSTFRRSSNRTTATAPARTVCRATRARARRRRPELDGRAGCRSMPYMLRVEVNGKLFRVKFVDLPPATVGVRGAVDQRGQERGQKGGPRRATKPTNQIRSADARRHRRNPSRA